MLRDLTAAAAAQEAAQEMRCDPSRYLCFLEWGFPKIRGTILGVPIIRTIVYWGLYWGPLLLGICVS